MLVAQSLEQVGVALYAVVFLWIHFALFPIHLRAFHLFHCPLLLRYQAASVVFAEQENRCVRGNATKNGKRPLVIYNVATVTEEYFVFEIFFIFTICS